MNSIYHDIHELYDVTKVHMNNYNDDNNNIIIEELEIYTYKLNFDTYIFVLYQSKFNYTQSSVEYKNVVNMFDKNTVKHSQYYHNLIKNNKTKRIFIKGFY